MNYFLNTQNLFNMNSFDIEKNLFFLIILGSLFLTKIVSIIYFPIETWLIEKIRRKKSYPITKSHRDFFKV